MKRLLWNRIVIVRAEFDPDGTVRTDALRWRAGGMDRADRAEGRRALAILMVCGHGVIVKPAGSQIARRVRSDAQTFLFNSYDAQIAFVRRERIEPLREALRGEGIVPIRVFCAGSAADAEHLAGEWCRQTLAALKWKYLLTPSAESSAALQALVRRSALPILGLLFGLLASNAVLSPRLNARRQRLQTEVSARQAAAAGAATATARQRELLSDFAARSGFSRAVVCDRIARAVPERVVLRSLEIDPPLKRRAAGMPFEVQRNSAVISGSAPAAADVSTFVQRLSADICCRDVRLAQVERARDSSDLLFRIEIAL